MSYQVEFHSRDDLSSNLEDELERRFQEQWGHIAIHWAKPPGWYVLAKHEEKLVGSLEVFERSISVGGESLTVGGIGGVLTNPEWRGRGVARAMLKRSEEFLKDELGVDFGLLICGEKVAPVYAKCGWFPVAGPTTFQQPHGAVVYRQLTMILPCNGRQWPGGEIDLCGLPW